MKNKKYLALPWGKECREENPYDKHYEGTHSVNLLWSKFEATNPTYPLTEVMPEGETFSGEDTWWFKLNNCTTWHQATLGEYETYSTYEDWVYYLTDSGNHPVETRIAIKPVKAIEPVKEEVKDWKPNDVGSNPNECIFPTCTKDNCRCDVVENKEETVEQAAHRLLTLHLGKPTHDEIDCFHLGANRQQSQSIEGIVGFVLEWLNTNAQPMDIVVGGFHNHKSGIIKEYNNEK